jgi:hypothetical protein
MVPSLAPFPNGDTSVDVPVQGDDVDDTVAIQVRQCNTVRYGQPLDRQTTLLLEVPATLPIAPEPEEAIPRFKFTDGIAPGNDIEMPVPIEVAESQPWSGYIEDFQVL